MKQARLPSRETVLAALESIDQPWHLRELATAVGLKPYDVPALDAIVDQLVFDGLVSRRPGQRIVLRRDRLREETVEAVLNMNPRGFGFVNDTKGRGIFLAPDSLRGAMHGDRVRVAIRRQTERGPEGVVLEVVSRARARVAGVLRSRNGSRFVEPDDPRVRGPVVLTRAIDSEADSRSPMVAPGTLSTRMRRSSMMTSRSLSTLLRSRVRLCIRSASISIMSGSRSTAMFS